MLYNNKRTRKRQNSIVHKYIWGRVDEWNLNCFLFQPNNIHSIKAQEKSRCEFCSKMVMLTELCCVLSTRSPSRVLFTFRLTVGFKAEFRLSCVVLLHVILHCSYTYLNESTLLSIVASCMYFFTQLTASHKSFVAFSNSTATQRHRTSKSCKLKFERRNINIIKC